MRTVLVTGGTGMIGRKVVELLADNYSVTSVSLDDLKLDKRVKYVKADLSDFKACCKLVKGMHAVYHVAGVKGSPRVTYSHPASFFVPILQMNTNILEACRRADIEKVAYVSSIGATRNENGNLLDEYPGWAKLTGEKQIEAYRLQYGYNWSIFRPTNVFGEGDNFDPDNAMVIPSLMAKIARGDDPVVVWGDGSAVRDFAYSGDVAKVIVDLTGFAREANIGGLRPVSIRELVDELHKITPFNHQFTGETTIQTYRVMKDATIEWATTFEEVLRKTWEWYIRNQNEYKKKKNYFTEK